MPGEVHLHPHSANVHRAAAVNPLGTDAPGRAPGSRSPSGGLGSTRHDYGTQVIVHPLDRLNGALVQ